MSGLYVCLQGYLKNIHQISSATVIIHHLSSPEQEGLRSIKPEQAFFYNGSTFKGTIFYKSSMKYCSFKRCEFHFIEFRNVNFRGCKFRGSDFKNVIFENCILEKADFTDATFVNVYYINTDVSKARKLYSRDGISPINEQSVSVKPSSDLQLALKACKNNLFILSSDTLFKKKKNRYSTALKRELKTLSKSERKAFQRQLQKEATSPTYLLSCVNLKRLLDNYSEKEVANGLMFAAQEISKPFSSVSYFIPYIHKASSSSI